MKFTPAIICAIAIYLYTPLVMAEGANNTTNRTLAAPTFPESFQERYWDEGKIRTDFGMATYQDMIAKRDAMTLTLRSFMVPLKTWEYKLPKQMLDDARDHMLAGDANLKLEGEKEFTVDGFPGRSFLLKRAGLDEVIRMDYLLLKPDLFIFYYSGPRRGLKTDDVKHFFSGIKTMQKDGKHTSSSEPGH